MPVPPGPTVAGRLIRWFVSGVRWTITIAAALIVIAIGQSIPALHRLDALLDVHKPVLTVVLSVLLAIGFIIFMGTVIRLLVRGWKGDEVTFREITAAVRKGSWRRDRRMRRFFTIAFGVVLMLTAGAAMAIVLGEPWVKFVAILASVYVTVVVTYGFYRSATSRSTRTARSRGDCE